MCPKTINLTYLEKSKLVSMDCEKRSNVWAAGIRIVVTRKGFVVSNSDLQNRPNSFKIIFFFFFYGTSAHFWAMASPTIFLRSDYYYINPIWKCQDGNSFYRKATCKI
jgi:hypothetical protein